MPHMGSDRIQFIGHACLWITLNDQHFIVDANFSKKICLGIKRHGEVGIDVTNLPEPSALLLTHAHYDHFDISTYKYFRQKTPLMVPAKLAGLIVKHYHFPTTELGPWETSRIAGVAITAVPTKHFSFRLSGLRYRGSCGFVLQGSESTVYIAGDTAYGSHFKEIAQKFKIDIACLPIGAYRPRFPMKYQHMDPGEALQAFRDLNARQMIPIHWGSFRLALDRVNEPLEKLLQQIEKLDIGNDVKILQPGQALKINKLQLSN